MSMIPGSNIPFGEVVVSSLTECRVQVWEWDVHPTCGTFITVHDADHLYAAIIYNIETLPLDSARTPVAYKKTHGELSAEHPHIFSLLKTTVYAVFLGIYFKDTLSPITKPPRIHSFSSVASETEIVCVTDTSLYIRTIMNHLEPHVADTVVYALVAQQKNNNHTEHLHAILTEYIHYVGNDYKRIQNLSAHLRL